MKSDPKAWLLANPWFWCGVGAGLAALAVLLAVLTGESTAPARFFLCATGLIGCAGGLTIRLHSPSGPFTAQLGRSRNQVLLVLLVAVLALTAIGWTGLLFAALVAAFRETQPTLRVGVILLLWFLIVPMSVQAAQNVWRRMTGNEGLSHNEESALLLYSLGFVAFLCSWSIYNPDDPASWDSIRTVFAVVASVAVAAAPIFLLSTTWRRAVLSAVFVLHFGGITSAVLAAPPSPWLVGQVWMRIYRPYLEFMYLNNAYHFYAPEPGPASYLWFRLTYEDPKKGDIYPLWIKVPDYDEKTGKHRYPLALNYQRHLAMTENISAPPALTVMTEADGVTPADFVRRRAFNTPQGAKEWEKEVRDQVLGKKAIEDKPGPLLIPLHRAVPLAQQYYSPQAHVHVVIESFARHVAGRPYPGHPEYKLQSLKIYRVRHEIPPAPIGANVNNLKPRDPELYRPFYLGEYDTNGKLKKDQDPFLYWLLPIQKEAPDGMVRDWARRHAGDPRWVWNEHKKEWIEGPDPHK